MPKRLAKAPPSRKKNEIVIRKNPILRFPSVVVRLEEWRVVDQLNRLRIAHASRS